MIELTNVGYTVSQGAFKPVIPVVKKMNLMIEQGVSMGFIGKNGAGKTTTFKLCTGIITPTTGTVRFNGQETMTREFQNRIGFLTENQYFPQHLTVLEWIRTLGRLSGLQPRHLKKRINVILALLDLETLSDRRILTLSKGQTQRIGFAQAMLHEPDILVLDEPMTGMDPLWRSRIQTILLEFKHKGGTLLFSSHVMSDVLRLSDALTVIDNGAIKWQGKMKDIIESTAKYKAIISCSDLEPIEANIKYDLLEAQPDGSYVIHFPADQKKKLMAISIETSVSIESLIPLFPDIEAFLA